MLKLTQTLQTQINAHGIVSYPNEGCGLLLGHSDNGNNVVKSILPVPNRWENEAEKPIRFRIAPADMLAAEMEAIAQDLDIIGVFHSHPDNPPIASPRDLKWAAWAGFSYLITEIRSAKSAGSRSWQLLLDRSGFVEEKVEL